MVLVTELLCLFFGARVTVMGFCYVVNVLGCVHVEFDGIVERCVVKMNE